MRLEEPYRGAQEVFVYKGQGKEPHFIISGAYLDQIDKRLVREYLNGCDWTDRGSPGWVTPQVRCDDFLTGRAKARMELATIYG